MSAQDYSVENSLRFGWSSMVGTLHPERVSHLEKYLTGKNVLDAGCGGGGFVEFLCSQGFRVTGLDYHSFFLDIARKQENAKGVYVQGDITALPFADQEFDCAFCYDVLEHVDDKQALRELVRVSKQRVIFAVPANDDNFIGCGLTFRHYQDLTHLRTYTKESLSALCLEIGQLNFQIQPELAVDLRGVAINHLDDVAIRSAPRALAQRLYHRLLRKLLMRARYQIIHSGWVVVIDLAKASTSTTTLKTART